VKIVKESLFEKFVEDSDPITDLGIGMKQVFKNLKEGDILQYKPWHADTLYYLQIYEIIKHYDELVTFRYYKYKSVDDLLNRKSTLKYADKFTITYEFFKERCKKVNKEDLIKESLNEKFTEDSDPIKDLGIGAKHFFDKFLKFLKEEKDSYFDYTHDSKELTVSLHYFFMGDSS